MDGTGSAAAEPGLPGQVSQRSQVSQGSQVSPADLLGRDYWLVLSAPRPGTTRQQIEERVPAHVSWLLELEQAGVVFLSGPLISGPGTGPGSGITVLRAASAGRAAEIAAGDPFVRAGLRGFEVFGWRVNEGSVGVRLSLGAGRFTWE